MCIRDRYSLVYLITCYVTECCLRSGVKIFTEGKCIVVARNSFLLAPARIRHHNYVAMISWYIFPVVELAPVQRCIHPFSSTPCRGCIFSYKIGLIPYCSIALYRTQMCVQHRDSSCLKPDLRRLGQNFLWCHLLIMQVFDAYKNFISAIKIVGNF